MIQCGWVGCWVCGDKLKHNANCHQQALSSGSLRQRGPDSQKNECLHNGCNWRIAPSSLRLLQTRLCAGAGEGRDNSSDETGTDPDRSGEMLTPGQTCCTTLPLTPAPRSPHTLLTVREEALCESHIPSSVTTDWKRTNTP